jgi:hypothetical protein
MGSYPFKYLLYETRSERFTRREAIELSKSYKRLGLSHPLLLDLSQRSRGYGKKMMSNLRRYPDLLGPITKALQRTIDANGARFEPSNARAEKYFRERSEFSGVGSVRTVSGGLPSLGKKR